MDNEDDVVVVVVGGGGGGNCEDDDGGCVDADVEVDVWPFGLNFHADDASAAACEAIKAKKSWPHGNRPNAVQEKIDKKKYRQNINGWTYQQHLPMLVDHVEIDLNRKMHEMVNVEMHVPVIMFRQIHYYWMNEWMN